MGSLPSVRIFPIFQRISKGRHRVQFPAMMPVANILKISLAIGFAILSVVTSHATSLVVIVTPSGIVYASDTGYNAGSGDLTSAGRIGTHLKLKIIQNRLVVASAGIIKYPRANK